MSSDRYFLFANTHLMQPANHRSLGFRLVRCKNYHNLVKSGVTKERPFETFLEVLGYVVVHHVFLSGGIVSEDVVFLVSKFAARDGRKH